MSMNYGFDGDQLDALEWARQQAYASYLQARAHRHAMEEGSEMSQHPDWQKKCIAEYPKSRKREEELRKYTLTLDELAGVTRNR